MEQFTSVLHSVMAINLIIQAFIGDNPKRAFLRNSLQHSAKFACEYCFGCGITFTNAGEEEIRTLVNQIQNQKNDIQQKIDLLGATSDTVQLASLNTVLKHLNDAESAAKKKNKCSHVVWPASTFDAEERTKEKFLSIVEDIEAGQDLSNFDKKGIKGRSPLLNLDYFDYVHAIPTEYMHLLSLGVVKRLLELTFSVGENRPRITTRSLTPPTIFNECMKTVKVVYEFGRRARKLDLSVMKAQELRNILLFFFPLITKSLQGNEKEIKLWEMLAFMIRACILPENEFNEVNVNHIKYCQRQFYLIYQQLFGEKNCTYSIHVLCSHLMQIRFLGPLTETSAFRFENFYGELRNSFQPGTQSVVKQMMQNVMLKRILSKHVCQEKIYLRAKDTALESNCLIYIYENSKHMVFKIKSIDNDHLTCNQLGNHDLTMPYTNMLNWSAVGVYRKGGLASTDVIINRKNVCGKVIVVDKYLITCPNNILREK